MIYSLGQIVLFKNRRDDLDVYAMSATADIAAHARHLDAESLFVGKLSNDSHGKYIQSLLSESDIFFPLDRSTAPTDVIIASEGRDSYSDFTANFDLDFYDISRIHFRQNDILSINSNGFVHTKELYSTHLHAINKCKLAGGIISFYIDFNPSYWLDVKEARTIIGEIIELSDIIFIKESELQWILEGDSLLNHLNVRTEDNKFFVCIPEIHSFVVVTNKGILSIPKTTEIHVNPSSFVGSFLAKLQNTKSRPEDLSTEMATQIINDSEAYTLHPKLTKFST